MKKTIWMELAQVGEKDLCRPLFQTVKPFLLTRSGSLALVLTALTLSSAQSATKTWTNTGSDFNTGGNWTGGLPTTSDIAALASTVTAVNPNLSSSITIQTLTIDNSGADYSITQTGGSVLTLALATPAITITGGGSTTIDPEVRMGGTKTFSTGSTALNLQGGLGIISANLSLTLTNSSPVVVSSITTRDGASPTARTLSLDGTGSMSVTGAIAPGAGMALVRLESAKSYGGTLALGGNNTFSTGTIWRAGRLELSNNGALGGQGLALGSTTAGALDVAVLATTAISTAGNITFNSGAVNTSLIVGGTHTTGTTTYSGTLSLANLTAANNGLKVTSASGGTVEFTGAISGAAVNGAIIKEGAGIVRFTGSNTYSGTTVVNAGTLLINGTHATAGAYTVNSGGTLGGAGTVTTTGSVGVTVASGGKIAPGSAAGSTGVMTLALSGSNLNVSGAVTGSNTDSLVFDLAATGGSDRISLTTGTLAIGSGLLEFDDFDFTLLSGIGAGTYTLISTANTISGTLGSTLSGSLGSFSGTSYNGLLSLGDSNTDLVLTVTAVPEPSTYALMALGLASLVYLRRRKTNVVS